MLPLLVIVSMATHRLDTNVDVRKNQSIETTLVAAIKRGHPGYRHQPSWPLASAAVLATMAFLAIAISRRGHWHTFLPSSQNAAADWVAKGDASQH